MPKTSSGVDRQTLEKAAEIIQTAHDIIETVGFNIDTYGGHRIDAETDSGTPRYAMCYIGTMRYAAGIDPTPTAELFDIACEGDGEELVIALKALDKVAKKRMPKGARQGVREEYREEGDYYRETCSDAAEIDSDRWEVGRFVENLGFQIQAKAVNKFPDDHVAQLEYQREYALKLLRRALSDLYR